MYAPTVSGFLLLLSGRTGGEIRIQEAELRVTDPKWQWHSGESRVLHHKFGQHWVFLKIWKSISIANDKLNTYIHLYILIYMCAYMCAFIWQWYISIVCTHTNTVHTHICLLFPTQESWYFHWPSFAQGYICQSTIVFVQIQIKALMKTAQLHLGVC